MNVYSEKWRACHTPPQINWSYQGRYQLRLCCPSLAARWLCLWFSAVSPLALLQNCHYCSRRNGIVYNDCPHTLMILTSRKQTQRHLFSFGSMSLDLCFATSLAILLALFLCRLLMPGRNSESISSAAGWRKTQQYHNSHTAASVTHQAKNPKPSPEACFDIDPVVRLKVMGSIHKYKCNVNCVWPSLYLSNAIPAQLTIWLRERGQVRLLPGCVLLVLEAQASSRSSSLKSSSVSMPIAAPISNPNFFCNCFLCRANRSLGSISPGNEIIIIRVIDCVML